MQTKTSGLILIVLGLIIIAFPLLGILPFSLLLGISVLFLGMGLLIAGVIGIRASTTMGVVELILGIIAIICGIGLFGHILLFSFLASIWLYFVGFFLIISGIMSLFAKEGTAGKGSGGMGIILGILYIILGTYAWDPYYLALLIGIWLIIDGIALFFVSPSDLVGMEKSEMPK